MKKCSMIKPDKHIKNIKGICDCFHTDKAKKYIGKYGYFSNYLFDYKDLSKTKHSRLTMVTDEHCVNYPYFDDVDTFVYFLPDEFVETSRCFSINEFKENLHRMIFNDDGLIHFKHKCKVFEEYALCYNGCFSEGDDWFVRLGTEVFSLKELFENFEFIDMNREWNIFGV